MRDDDRYLQRRGKRGFYQYIRRVPGDVAEFDSRQMIQLSLKTTDLYIARKRRDAQEQLDDALWDAMRRGHSDDDLERYQAASKLARATGFQYLPASELTSRPLHEIAARVDAAYISGQLSPPIAAATLGGAPSPIVTITRAFDFYFDDIAIDERKRKSPKQYRKWKVLKERARNRFISLCGDIDISSLTRDHGLKLYNFWKLRIEKEGQSPSNANRDLGNMRLIFKEYHNHIGREDLPNPFRGLSFSERKLTKRQKKWPPFSVDWISGTLMRPGALKGLNREAALIFYSLIETGCRPSEPANIRPENIILDHEIPHIIIQPEEGREIKTDSSLRIIPLVGVSLAAFKKAPNGFPRYQDKEDGLSQLLMRTLRNRGLLETEKHAVYSLRHAFEDRMKEAGIDPELRRYLMGHDNSREEYGEFGSLAWKRDQLKKIALPFEAHLLKDFS